MTPFIDSPPPQPPSRQRAITPDSLSRPRPRPTRSAEQTAQVRRLNRRREWLDRNPEYFKSVEHELADPLLYDTLIRRFQSPAEREAEGRAKGYGRVLETSLLRGEAKLERMAASYVDGGPGPESVAVVTAASSSSSVTVAGDGAGGLHGTANGDGGSSSNMRETNFSIESDLSTPPADREEARGRWVDYLRDRFVRGQDDEFDYGPVDGDEEFDVLERRDAEEAWFEGEEPGWEDSADSAGGRARNGETGVQDF